MCFVAYLLFASLVDNCDDAMMLVMTTIKMMEMNYYPSRRCCTEICRHYLDLLDDLDDYDGDYL